MPNRYQFNSNEEYNLWFKEYRAKNREKFRRYFRKYNKEWRKQHGYYNEEKWKQKNPEKVLAQKILQQAVKKGLIKKKPCKICGDINSVAHHPNYCKPLKIMWLCKIHHRQIHYERK